MKIRRHVKRGWEKVLRQIANESSRSNIPLSMAAGAVLGLFPVLGTTTALCLVAAVIFRLSLPVTQALNFLVYPLQLFLAVPFALAGRWLFDIFPIPLPSILSGPAGSLSLPVIHAVFAWVLLSIPMAAALQSVFRKLVRRSSTR